MMRLFFVGILAALLAAPACAQAQAPSYHVTVLDPSSTEIAYPAAINSSGEIVGSVGPTSFARDAATWINGVFTDVSQANGMSGAQFSGVSNSGDIAGTFISEGSYPSYALVDIGGTITEITTWPYYATTSMLAINDSDVAVGVGYVSNPPSEVFYPFLWANGVLTDLGLPKGGVNGYPVAINDNGLIAGDVEIAANNQNGYTSNGFFYSNGQFTILPASIAFVGGMNQAGAVTGNTLDSVNRGVPLVYANGVITLYKLPKGAITAGGTAIDSYNDIAGGFSDAAGTGHGMVAAFNQACYDLNSELDSSGAGLMITYITSMNDSGEIVGEATNLSTKKSSGVLLTLNGTPSTASLAPAFAPALSGFTLTVNGANFSPLSVVEWNGTPLVTHLVSGTKLTATVPLALNPVQPGNTYPDTATVTVTQLGGTTAPLSFTIADPRPTLTSLNPSTIDAGAPTTTITLTGTGFAQGAVANWNGADLATTLVSSTKLTATVPQSMLASAGTFYVLVINPTTGGGSVALPFTITTTSLTLHAGTATLTSGGAFSVPVTLTNSGFEPAPSVQITSATLGGQATTTTLPVTLTTLAPGKSDKTTLTFPAITGTSAQVIVSGVYTGGSFSVKGTVTLP